MDCVLLLSQFLGNAIECLQTELFLKIILVLKWYLICSVHKNFLSYEHDMQCSQKLMLSYNQMNNINSSLGLGCVQVNFQKI